MDDQLLLPPHPGEWPEFRPLPLLGNPHLQTIVANWFAGGPVRFPVEIHTVELPDGDRLAIHESAAPGWQPGGPIALLVHGLAGTHRSGYLVRLTNMLVPRGFRVARMDLRGCGEGTVLARRPYHGGLSGDIGAVVRALRGRFPDSPVSLVGFSLGGNLVLKLAGETAMTPSQGIRCVVAVGPPLDFERCSELLHLPRNRFYNRHFVRELVRQVKHRQTLFPDLLLPDFTGVDTMREFDNRFTAPTWGFRDADDYYRQASSYPLVNSIEVPTLILTARDDPFIAAESFEKLRPPKHIQLRIFARGGHIGFLGWDGRGGVRWAERRLADWLSALNPTSGEKSA